MKPGIWEIIIIVILIVVVAIIARVVRGSRLKAREDNAAAETSPGPRRIVRRTGIAGIAVGVILLAAAVSMFGYAFRSLWVGFVIIAIGLVLVFLTRKKR